VRHVAAAAALLALAAAGAAGGASRELEGNLRSSDRPDGRPVQVLRVDGVDYLDVQEIARLFRATKYWRPELGKMVLKIGERRATLTVGSPFVYVDGQGTNLLAPIVWHEGRMFAPVRLATHVLDPLVPETVRWLRDVRELRVLRGDPNVLGLAWDLRGNGTVVAIRLAEPLAAELATGTNRAVVRVPGGRLAGSVPERARGVGFVDSVEVAEEPDAATFTFHLSAMAGPVELLARTSPARLELVVRDVPDLGEIPAPAFEPPVGFPAPRDVRVVVLDPAHGGSDSGASSEQGPLVEKEISLAIAVRARVLLEADGFEVHLTRQDDRFVAPEARARVANARHADVYLSIHANAWFDPELEGVSVGLRAPDPGPPPESTGEPRRWGQRDAASLRDAEVLAEILAKRLGEATGRPSRGVKTNAWAPLAGVSGPAALVECGFLTNEGDAKRLGQSAYRDDVARALAESVREFRDAMAARGGEGGP